MAVRVKQTGLPEEKELSDFQIALERLTVALTGIYMQRQLEQANQTPGTSKHRLVTTRNAGWVQLCAGEAMRKDVTLTLPDDGSTFTMLTSDDTQNTLDLATRIAANWSAADQTPRAGAGQIIDVNVSGPNSLLSPIVVATTGPIYAFAFQVVNPAVSLIPIAYPVGINVVETIYTGPRSIPEALGIDSHAKASTLMRPDFKLDHLLGDETFTPVKLH
jgi:hypothetical protein